MMFEIHWSFRWYFCSCSIFAKWSSFCASYGYTASKFSVFYSNTKCCRFYTISWSITTIPTTSCSAINYAAATSIFCSTTSDHSPAALQCTTTSRSYLHWIFGCPSTTSGTGYTASSPTKCNATKLFKCDSSTMFLVFNDNCLRLSTPGDAFHSNINNSLFLPPSNYNLNGRKPGGPRSFRISFSPPSVASSNYILWLYLHGSHDICGWKYEWPIVKFSSSIGANAP